LEYEVGEKSLQGLFKVTPVPLHIVLVGILGYASLVALTYFIVTLITPYDEQPEGDDAEGMAVGLFIMYPIVAPLVLMSAIKARINKRRERKFIEQQRADELLEIEYKTRLKELKSAEEEIDKFLERRD
jgi:hypothetical protein